jgi:hypothetical protein
MPPEPIYDAPLPDWMPPCGTSMKILPCARWWDAVRVPVHLGVHAVERLGERSGPVIASRKDHVLYWLIPTGAAAAWKLPSVRVWGAACYLTVPSAMGGDAVGDLRWLVPPQGDCLTDPATLHAALAETMAAWVGPRPEAAR